MAQLTQKQIRARLKKKSRPLVKKDATELRAEAKSSVDPFRLPARKEWLNKR
jgi:hypothetical protein